ncbi:MAG: hypothetical protein K1X83_09720 [Oligoflexia bacterium]|nr:hypothetical protein [Oligoflexia bacterium]
MKRSLRGWFAVALAAVSATMLLTGCFQEGDEARFLPTAPRPEKTVVDTLYVPLEARVAPDNSKFVAGSVTLLYEYERVDLFPTLEYQGSGAGHTKEVAAVGLKSPAEPLSAAQFGVLPGESCPGVPDSDQDSDPINDNGYHQRYAGSISNVAIGTQEIVLAHGAAFPCWGIAASDLPNDVGVPSVRLLCYRRVPA